MKKMTERERFLSVFDQMGSLAERPSWTNGLFNLFEWLTWNTRHLLGKSKTTLWKDAIEFALSDDFEKLSSLDSISKQNQIREKQDQFYKKLIEGQKAAEENTFVDTHRKISFVDTHRNKLT